MKAWRESEPATADSEIAPLSLRHILGAPPADTWWSQHRNLLWSLSGWLTSAAVVVSAGYLLWAMMYRHASDADPFLGLPRPRATSTTAPPLDERRTEVAEVLKVVRPEPLSVATTASSVVARSTTVPVNGGSGADSGRSGPDPGPGGPASPTTVPSASGGATITVDDGGGRNRGQGGGSPEASSSTTTARTTASTTTPTTGTTRPTSSPSTSTSTSSTVDDKGGDSGSGSGGGSGSGSGGSGKG